MRNQRQNVRSTKRGPNSKLTSNPVVYTPVEKATGRQVDADDQNLHNLQGDAGGAAQIPNPVPEEKKRDIFVAIYEPRDTMFTDQTGRFPQ